MGDENGAGQKRVVVGVDPSPAAQAALAWAAEEARLRHAAVHAVHAWQFPAEMAVSAAGGALPPMGEMKQWAEEVLDDALAAAGVGPDVPVIRDTPEGPAAPVLREVCRGAELLVVGTRGHSRLTGLFLGSVSQYLVIHAPCPVLVVHGPRPAEAGGAEHAEGSAAPDAPAAQAAPDTGATVTGATPGGPGTAAGGGPGTGVLEEIPEEECLALLAGEEVGRLAVVDAGAPLVFPVNYTLDGRTVAVRTDAGTKLDWATLGRVAVEVDSIDPDSRQGWSVLVQGVGRDITTGVDEWSDHVRGGALAPWVAGEKAHWIAVATPTFSGRRIRSQAAPPDGAPGGAGAGAGPG